MADKHRVTTASIQDLLTDERRTSAPALARSRNIALWILIGFILITALLGRMVYVIKPFDHDARMFIYLGKLVCDGGRYCHDIIDNKFPSVGLMTSICWRLFGTHWIAYVTFQMVLAIGAALLLGRMAARHFGKSARLPTILFALTYLNLNVAVFGGFQLETMQTFFAILSAGAAMEAIASACAWDAFAAGLAAGCAMMLKPSGGAVLGAFALAVILKFHRRPINIIRLGFAAAGGLAIPALVTLAYIIHTDILRDMPALWHQISRYASETPMQASDWLKPVVVCVVAGFPLAVRGFVFRRDRETPVCSSELSARRAMCIFAIAWFALEMLGVILQRRMYSYHFLPLAAPAALLFGMIPRRLRVAPLAAALIPAAMLSLLGTQTIFSACYPPVWRLPASDYLLAHTKPTDCVWEDSVPRLLLETNLHPGARIPLTFLFFNYDTAPIEYSNVILHDFDVRKPRYILLPQDLARKIRYETARAPEMLRRPLRAKNYRIAWHNIDHYVRANYVAETVIDGETLWRRESSIAKNAAQ